MSDWVIGLLFVWAAWPKLLNPEGFAESIVSYRLISGSLAWFASLFLPIFEFTWALLLLLGYAKTAGRWVLWSLLAGYTAVILITLFRGIDIDCGCMGDHGASLQSALVRNVLVMATCGSFILVSFWIRKSKGEHQAMEPRHFSKAIVMVGMLVILLVSNFEGAISKLYGNNSDTSYETPAGRDAVVNDGSDTKELVPEPSKHYMRTYDQLRDWRGNPMTYWVNMPSTFQKDKTYPILLEWHGAGGSAKTRLFPDVYQVDGFIHVGLTYAWGNSGGKAPLYPDKEYIEFIQNACEDLKTHFNGDLDRIVIGGFSAGGNMSTGAGIATLWRAGYRGQLKAVVAGGCNWMCDPRYAKGLRVFLWYSKDDLNSSDLARRIPEVKKHALSVQIVERPGNAHRCMNEIEGPDIRKFLDQFTK